MTTSSRMTSTESVNCARIAGPFAATLTRYAEPSVARIGAGAWLKKPYTAANLAEKVREILSQ